MPDIKIQLPSLLTLLTVLFVGLKLTHQIAWSWWLVTLPLWGGFAFALAVILVIGAIALLVHLLD